MFSHEKKRGVDMSTCVVMVALFVNEFRGDKNCVYDNVNVVYASVAVAVVVAMTSMFLNVLSFTHPGCGLFL